MMTKKLLLNPLVLFLGSWTLVFWLLSLRVSGILLPLPTGFAFPVGVISFSGFLGYVIGFYVLGASKRKPVHFSNPLRRVRFIIKPLFCLMNVILPVTVVIAGGLPILYYVGGPKVRYSSFGIPTLHGFFNSLVVFTGTLCFWLLISKNSSVFSNLIFLVCLAIPVVSLHRASLMILVLQCLMIYIGVKVKGLNRHVILLAFLVLLVLFTFGVLGDLRTDGAEQFRRQIQLKPEFQWAPSWLLWPYIYLATPLNNFAHMTTLHNEPTYSMNVFSRLVPTALRRVLWSSDRVSLDSYLVKSNFTVSTYASHLYLGWGWPGVIGVTGFLLTVSGYAFRKFLRRRSLLDLVRLAVLDQIILLLVFSTLFMSWVVLFQFVLLYLFRKRLANTGAFAGVFAAREERPSRRPTARGGPPEAASL